MRLHLNYKIFLFLLFFNLSLSGQDIQPLADASNDTAKVTRLLDSGIAFQQKNADSATVYFSKAIALAESLNSLEKSAESYLQQGIHQQQLGNFSSADSLLQLALNTELSLSRPIFLVKIYQNVAVTKQNLQQYDLALNYLDKAEEIVPQLTNSEIYLANINLDRGSIYFEKGQIEITNQYALRAIEIFEKAEQWEDAKAAALNLGINYLGIKAYAKTEFYGLKGLEFARKSENPTYLAYSYKILTAANSELGKQDTALNYALQSLKYWQEVGNPYEIGFSNRFIGKVLKNKGEYTTALPYLETSVSDFIAIDVVNQQMYSLAELGETYILLNRKKEGLALLAKVENLLNQHTQQIIDEQNILKLLENGYTAADEFSQAYTFRKRHDILQDSVEQKERMQQIQELETQYQVKEKEAQLVIQNAKLEQRNNLIIGITIIGLLLTGITFLMFRLARQRRKVNQQLRTLDTAKSTFFANVSHELRTPLTLILAPLDQAIKKSNNAAQKKDLELAHNNSKKLLTLVNEILDLSKLENGRIKVIQQAIQIAPFLKRVLFAFESLATLRGITLKFNNELKEDIWVKLDIPKVEKIINNLLSNALKYSAKGDSITLSLIINQGLEISVADTGKGISKTDLPRVFDRFYQSEQKSEQLQGGTGIGLALAKEYAQLLDGNLTVKSELGKKTIFTLQLPLIKTTPVITQQTPEINIIKEETTSAFQPRVLFADKPKILVVEDNLEMSQFLVNILSPTYRCTVAMNGAEGLEKLEKDRFDLITSDVMMPEMDGFTFLKKIHARELFSHTPVILLTARTLETDKLRGFQLGVDDYITKPFQPVELIARIDNLLKNKAEREKWQNLRNEAPSNEEKKQLTAEQQLLFKAETVVINHLSDSSFKVGNLAEALHYSQRQLERIIKKLTGLTPNNFIKEIRLQRAMELLQNRQFSTVAEVGFAVGFADAAYFTKVYQKRFGVKPSEVSRNI